MIDELLNNINKFCFSNRTPGLIGTDSAMQSEENNKPFEIQITEKVMHVEKS